MQRCGQKLPFPTLYRLQVQSGGSKRFSRAFKDLSSLTAICIRATTLSTSHNHSVPAHDNHFKLKRPQKAKRNHNALVLPVSAPIHHPLSHLRLAPLHSKEFATVPNFQSIINSIVWDKDNGIWSSSRRRGSGRLGGETPSAAGTGGAGGAIAGPAGGGTGLAAGSGASAPAKRSHYQEHFFIEISPTLSTQE